MDLYSSGITVYETIYGIKDHTWRYRQFKDEIKNNWNEKVSEESKEFVLGLIRYDPRQRMTFNQLVDHKWLIQKDFPNIVEE